MKLHPCTTTASGDAGLPVSIPCAGQMTLCDRCHIRAPDFLSLFTIAPE